ncbi:MAG: type I-C CRISPR-associated protein Cas7/Csd2 [Raoultibacter sp.]
MAIEKKYDFVLFFDVQDGNPNGDPDAGNLPRIDAETGEGLVTDVCIKRKIRNYVQTTQEGKEGFDIFIKEKAVLNTAIDAAYDEVDDGQDTKGAAKGKTVERARDLMCKRFFDIRTFGAVMSTGKNAGQVRGPVQFTFARSVAPIVTLEHSITRMAVTTEKESENQSGDNRTMGRKYTVPYGLYVMHGFISASLAAQTGFDEKDLELLWAALENMFEEDRSAARGLMSTRGIVIFEHDSQLGNAPASSLFDRVTVERVTEGPARNFKDFSIALDGTPISKVVTRVPVK